MPEGLKRGMFTPLAFPKVKVFMGAGGCYPLILEHPPLQKLSFLYSHLLSDLILINLIQIHGFKYHQYVNLYLLF